MELWLEFEDGKTKDTQIVRDLDRIECALELFTIEQKQCGKWRDNEMFEDQINKVITGECQRWKDTLVQIRNTFWKNRESYSQIVFLIGPPGAGKTTQGSRLAHKFDICHISAGDLLRQEVARPGSEYAQLISDHIKLKPPQPVPPRLVVDLLEREIEAASKAGQIKRLVIDGFPRDKAQAIEFEERICPSVNTILLDCDDDILIRRLQYRGVSSSRLDDNPEAIKSRVEAFKQQNIPVEKYMRNGSSFFEINCKGTEDEVYGKVKSCFEQMGGTTS
ncbi:hypothetical protein VTL71DRAFT_5008 [Oculimacula yallundae]|uniref:Adenylate kinase n=1 Tax=Oculimacula yallundae TaxID=86028 RepID=A0ABR4BZX2_9HELO